MAERHLSKQFDGRDRSRMATTVGMPPAGFEPALQDNPVQQTPGTVTGASFLPEALRAKLDELKERGDV